MPFGEGGFRPFGTGGCPWLRTIVTSRGRVEKGREAGLLLSHCIPLRVVVVAWGCMVISAPVRGASHVARPVMAGFEGDGITRTHGSAAAVRYYPRRGLVAPGSLRVRHLDTLNRSLTLYYELRGADGDLAEVQLRCVPRDASVTFRMSGDGFDFDPEYSFLPENASDGSLSSEPEDGAVLSPRDGSSTLGGASGLATAAERAQGSAVSREHRSRSRSPVNDSSRR